MNNKSKYKISKSNIHGMGVHANKNIRVNEVIGIAITFDYYIIPRITQDLGVWINHSYNPTSYLVYDKNSSNYLLVSSKNMRRGDEITVNYNDTPWFIKKPEPWYI